MAALSQVTHHAPSAPALPEPAAPARPESAPEPATPARPESLVPDAPRPRVPGAALLALVRTRTSGARAPEGKAAQCSYVVDRHGRKVPVQFDQITARNRELCDDEQYGARLRAIDCPLVTVEVIRRFRDGMTTRELDAETALICAQRTSHSSDYDALAARICVSDQHKRIPADQLEALDALRADAPDERSVRFTDELYAVARRARAAIAERLDHARDYRLKFFGFQTALGGLLRSGRRRDPLSLRDTRPSERLQHAYMRVALGIHVCQPDGKGAEAPEAAFRARLEEAFALYDALSAQLVSQATPTLLNAGTKRPQMSSCFQLGVGDDLDSILSTLREAGLISKWSGGISFWLHGVRSEGAPIRGTTGESSGLKYLLRLWNDMQRYVDQGGNRKGAFAATIADHHPNVLDVLRQARPGGEMSATGEDLSAADLKYALWVSDAFMEALTAQIAAEERAERGQDADPAAGDWPLFDPDVAPGLHLVHGDAFVALRARYIREGRAKVTVKAGAIIAEAFKAWSHVGTPYVMFKDAINRKSNMQNVAPICSSNLCVGGDTRVLTRRGYAAIRGLEGDAVEVWNGAEWSRVTVCKTNTAAALVRVTFGSGAQVECTPYHKFYTSASAEVRAGELQPGMRLERCPCMPVVEGGSPLRDAYARGLACAVRSPDVPASDTVPLYGSDVASRLEWFAGLCDGDAVRGEGHSIRVTSAGREFLLEVRLLLQTLGCDPKVVPEARRATPRDRAPRHHLLVTSGDTAALLRLGFRPRRLALAGDGGRVHRAGPSARVVSVERLEGLHETFCFTEPRRHRGIFNGVIGGQCCEITIPSWSEFDAKAFGAFHPDNAQGGEYGVCTLGAVNIAEFVDAKAKRFDFMALADAAGLEVRALDRVIDLNYAPTPECRRSSQRHRPLGIGVIGLADAIAMLGLAYDSDAARRFARAVAAAHYYGAVLASAQLATERGSYASYAGSPISQGRLQPDLWRECGDLKEDWEAEVEEATGGAIRAADWKELRALAQKGIRNAYVVAYMPTATSSNIVGQNESFEPFTANIYPRRTGSGEFTIINRHLVAALEGAGLWDDDMRRALIRADGSVQGLERVPSDIKRLFRTAREMHTESLVRMTKALAPFVCQSLSFNHYMDKPDLPRILRGLVAAWKAGLKTGMYYCHTSAAVSGQKTSVAPPAASSTAPARAPARAPASSAPSPGEGTEEPRRGPRDRRRSGCTEACAV